MALQIKKQFKNEGDRVNENWCAFCLCICKEINVDRALAIFNLRVVKQKPKKYPDELINKILLLRSQKVPYKQISRQLGISTIKAQNIVSNYKKL